MGRHRSELEREAAHRRDLKRTVAGEPVDRDDRVEAQLADDSEARFELRAALDRLEAARQM
jgi:hypothetical protein